jgi:hypothetical protein
LARLFSMFEGVGIPVEADFEREYERYLEEKYR